MEAEIDASGRRQEDGTPIFYVYVNNSDNVKPGESATVKVSVDSGHKTPGTVEGCVLKLTAYYPDSREKNTITADIPLSIKYLYDGGYEIANMSDNSYGTVKTSDGISRDPYSGSSRFNAILLLEDGSQFVYLGNLEVYQFFSKFLYVCHSCKLINLFLILVCD